MYCAWRIPAHLRCTQCSILLHLMDICFLTCICLWQISQIQTFLFKVVGPGLVSTSPAFVSCSASHPAGPHGRHAQKTVNYSWVPWYVETQNITLNLVSFCKWVSCMQHMSMFSFFSMCSNSVFFLITPSAFHCIILSCVFALLYSLVLLLGPLVRRDTKV